MGCVCLCFKIPVLLTVFSESVVVVFQLDFFEVAEWINPVVQKVQAEQQFLVEVVVKFEYHFLIIVFGINKMKIIALMIHN